MTAFPKEGGIMFDANKRTVFLVQKNGVTLEGRGLGVKLASSLHMDTNGVGESDSI